MPIIACKLPTGLSIQHKGKTLVLKGGNSGEKLQNVSENGDPTDNAFRASGFGLTEISDSDAELFADWSNAVTYKDGKAANGKLDHPFKPLENGSILGPFKTIDEARKEVVAVSDGVTTGFEGLDPSKEKVEDAKDDDGNSVSPRKTK